VRDGVAERQTVNTGYTNNGAVEIVDGLQPGDIVITVGQNSLKDGARVAVVNPEPVQTPVLNAGTEKVAATTP
ncbi:MAG TPA: efflux transporter periplasmic adaptor subunit, partial [Gammaproteobacteria bacterium]